MHLLRRWLIDVPLIRASQLFDKSSSLPTRILPIATLLSVFLAGCGDNSPRYQLLSSSMAPGLIGPTALGQCLNCGTDQSLALETLRPEFPVRCFGCGGKCWFRGFCRNCDHQCLLDPKTLVPQLSANTFRSEACPQCQLNLELRVSPGRQVKPEPKPAKFARFDRIVLENADRHEIKRIWALPGESVSIEDGDVWVNGELYPKSLAEFRALSVPVSHWGDGSKGWNVEGSLADGASSAETNDVLELTAGEALRWQYLKPAPVDVESVDTSQWLTPSHLDDDWLHNQGISYRPARVHDYAVEIVIEPPFEGLIRFRCNYRGQWIEWDVQGVSNTQKGTHDTTPSSKNSRAAEQQVSPMLAEGRATLACVDRRIMQHTDMEQRVLHWRASQETEPHLPPAFTQVEIRCLSGRTRLRSVQIHRDIHLRTDAPETLRSPVSAWKVPLHSYFVLGDNIPVSIDSRNGLGMVSWDLIVGSLPADQDGGQ